MQFIIVTGMSGAGKSTVLKILEDMGYFCVDNLPPSLISKFAEVCLKTDSDIMKVALGVDIRSRHMFEDFIPSLEEINKEVYDYKILFLDATDDTLLNRYKETRHTHPLSKGDRIIDGISKERKLLAEVKKHSNYIIETTHLLTRQLKEKISDLVDESKKFSSLMITILSFGFKFGIPTDSDLVFDVRFIPNPFYITELKDLTGNDAPVHDYVMEVQESRDFLAKLVDMTEFLIPNYIKEGKNQLVISIGCTGGKHRSVTLAIELYKSLMENSHSVVIRHRDINR